MIWSCCSPADTVTSVTTGDTLSTTRSDSPAYGRSTRCCRTPRPARTGYNDRRAGCRSELDRQRRTAHAEPFCRSATEQLVHAAPARRRVAPCRLRPGWPAHQPVTTRRSGWQPPATVTGRFCCKKRQVPWSRMTEVFWIEMARAVAQTQVAVVVHLLVRTLIVIPVQHAEIAFVHVPGGLGRFKWHKDSVKGTA